MYVTDTHALLWFLTNDDKLGVRARELFRSCDKGETIIVIPSIALLECLYICEKGKVDLEFRNIIEKTEGSLNYPTYPLDREVILNLETVKQMFDPHDRVIVAIAKMLNAIVITKDDKIRNSGLVKTIW